MLVEILTCAVMLTASAQDTLTTVDNAVEQDIPVVAEQEVKEPAVYDEKFWAKKKSFRLGYDMHTFQNASGVAVPVKFGVGFSRNRNVWLHKEPIAGMIKFAFDHGLNLGYTMFDLKQDMEDYTGPSGYVGTEPIESDGEGMGAEIPDLGSHYLSLGYALGASVTVNPVAKLRVNGYFHFVPSAAVFLSGMSFNLGFMPYCKYGAEVSYDWFGLGVEWGSGMSNMTDMITKMMGEETGMETMKSKYYSNYTRLYVAFRFGKDKKKKK